MARHSTLRALLSSLDLPRKAFIKNSTDTDPIYRYSKMVTLYCYSATYSLNITHMQHVMLYLVIVSHFQPCFNKKVNPTSTNFYK